MNINIVLHGDNLDILKSMEPDSIDLCYADPPFFTQKVQSDKKGVFNDKWTNINEYIEYIKLRVLEIKRVLKKTGSFYLHCDWHSSHYLKVECDNIFGYDNFINEIVWKRKMTSAVVKSKAKSFGNNHDVLLVYAKNHDKTVFHLIEKDFEISSFLHDEHGFYKSTPIGGHVPSTVDRMLAEGKAYTTKNGKIRLKTYLKKRDGKVYDTRPIDNIWTDIPGMANSQPEFLGYPTQKPTRLLKRVITASSNKGDVILDPFCGSGTTLVAAKELGRSYIGIDIDSNACEMAEKRLKSTTIQIKVI